MFSKSLKKVLGADTMKTSCIPSETVVLSLGGNLGDVPETFRNVTSELRDSGLFNIIMSSMYRTSPVACNKGTPDFINAVMTGEWGNGIESLLELCKGLESKYGRPAVRKKNLSRTIDLDIVLFGQHIIQKDDLTVPHPEAAKRLFVLIPLAEIDKNIFFPGIGKKVVELLNEYRGSEVYPEKI